MKAVDIVKRLEDGGFDVLTDVLYDMIKETKGIVDVRKCESDAAFHSVFREMDQKWQAVCNRGKFTWLDRDMYQKAVAVSLPNVYEMLVRDGVFPALEQKGKP